MYSPLIRIIFAAAGLFLAGKSFYEGDYLRGLIPLAAVILITVGYFMNGTVYAAFQKLTRQDFNGAKRMIAKTKKPEWLKKNQRSYYYFVTGMIAIHEERNLEAIPDLKNAIQLGLRTENDQCIAYLNLASAYIDEKQPKDARNALDKIRGLNPSKIIQDNMKMLEEKIS